MSGPGVAAGPRSTERARRCALRSMSRQMFVAIAYNQVRTDPRAGSCSARQARTMVSCTASSASKPDPSMR
jgi:hypothetical protein